MQEKLQQPPCDTHKHIHTTIDQQKSWNAMQYICHKSEPLVVLREILVFFQDDRADVNSVFQTFRGHLFDQIWLKLNLKKQPEL